MNRDRKLRVRQSLSARERGLKHGVPPCCCLGLLSLPVRERGLKLQFAQLLARTFKVAPRAGAWIEACEHCRAPCRCRRRSPCGNVDFMDLYYHGHNQNMPQHLEPAVLIYLLLSFKDVLRKIYNLFFRFVINIVLILIRFLFLDFYP